jgi:hypothetical protein
MGALWHPSALARVPNPRALNSFPRVSCSLSPASEWRLGLRSCRRIHDEMIAGWIVVPDFDRKVRVVVAQARDEALYCIPPRAGDDWKFAASSLPKAGRASIGFTPTVAQGRTTPNPTAGLRSSVRRVCLARISKIPRSIAGSGSEHPARRAGLDSSDRPLHRYRCSPVHLVRRRVSGSQSLRLAP